jgi:hypothetical protein
MSCPSNPNKSIVFVPVDPSASDQSGEQDFFLLFFFLQKGRAQAFDAVAAGPSSRCVALFDPTIFSVRRKRALVETGPLAPVRKDF